MSEPKIYTIVDAPLMGQLGETAVYADDEDRCRICGQSDRRKITFLDYAFDYWDGQPFLWVASHFAVTRDFGKSLQGRGFSGFDLQDMRAEYWDTFDPDDGGENLVPFCHLVVQNTIRAGSGWWTRVGVCETCGRTTWESNDNTIRARFRAATDPEIPQRTILREDYQGWDIFFTDEPGATIVTERFRDALTDAGVRDLVLQEARFVDSLTS